MATVIDQARLVAHGAWGASSGTEGERLELPGADLSGADLTGANLSGAVLIEAELVNAVLTRAQLQGVDLYRAFAAGARVDGADLTAACLVKADFSGAVLTGAVLRRVNALRADFTAADLTRVDLTESWLAAASVSAATLTGCRLVDCDAPRFAVGDSRFDVSSVTGMQGWLIRGDEPVTLLGEGPERSVGIAELAAILTARGARVDAWRADDPEARPDDGSWRFASEATH